MAVHPPLLYLGYVGLTVPFAFAMGALLARRTDERWIVATRRWTLAAWAFLGVGQLLGAHWAYVEIGWGGYYAWDPVENAALMPWLAATAFLHSVMIQEKRGMLKVWNVLLVVLAFCLSLFGTFLTRSGIIQSIHSFTQSSIGPWFLGFICLITAGSLALVFLRLPLLRAKDAARVARLARGDVPLQQPAARRARADDPLGRRLSAPVGGGHRYGGDCEQAVLQLLPAHLRAAVAAADGDRTARRVAPRLAARARAHLPLAARRCGRRRHRPARCGRGLVACRRDRVHVLCVRARVDRAGVRARHECAQGARRGRLGGAFSSLVARNRRRYGGYVVHAAVVLLAIGVAGSSAYQTVREAASASGRLDDGRRQPAGLPRLRDEDGVQPSRDSRERRRVQAASEYLGRYRPGKNQYFAEDQVSNEVSIRHDLLTGGDLFLIADQVNADGSVDLKALQKPLVNLLWLAGLVFVGGSLIALWPDAREERRLAERYEGATVRA